MNFRTILLAQGLTEKDIEEALQEARQATRVVHSLSGLAVEVFTKVAAKAPPGRKQLILVKGALVAQKVQASAELMLKKR